MKNLEIWGYRKGRDIALQIKGEGIETKIVTLPTDLVLEVDVPVKLLKLSIKE